MSVAYRLKEVQIGDFTSLRIRLFNTQQGDDLRRKWRTLAN